MVFLLLASMYFSSRPLAFAYYTVDHASFPPDLPGDVNADHVVDGGDLIIISKAYGSYFGGSRWDPRADVTDDGKVDGDDNIIVARLFGKSYNTSIMPIAYSTSFEFTVPDDGDEEVHYYLLVRTYMPSSLSGQVFYFNASIVDDWVLNVKIDCKLKYAGSTSNPACQPVYVELGNLNQGYHLLEFEFVEKSGGGMLSFYVTTANGNYVWLDRFRTCVPNYTAIEYRYMVKTHYNFTISDRYFIRGFADDYIDDIKLGGGWLYQDWQWSSYWTAIYAWGDGFNVPCGYLDPPDWRDIELIYGVMSGGMLDFQILSFTKQSGKIAKGTPEFWASVMALPDYCMVMKDKKLHAGSEWYSDPGLSDRKIVVSQELYFAKYAYDTGPLLWDARVLFDVGVAWLDSVIDSETSFGITINLTYLGGVEKPKDSVWLTMVDIGATVPTQALNVLGWEFKDVQGGKSIVNSNFKIVTDMTIAAILAYASTFALPVGAVVGLAASGAMVKGIFDYVKDTQETPFKYYGYENNYASAYIEAMRPIRSGQSVSETGFVRVKPVAPTHCGFVEVYVDGTIEGASVFTRIRFPVYVT